jgi:proline iminopeptidase
VVHQSSRSPEDWSFETADGCRIFVTEQGAGPTVVAVHGGWGAELSALRDGLAPLGEEFRVVCYDQRGSLRSPCPPDGQITVEAHVKDLEQLRSESGEDRLVIVGHSMGCYLALEYLEAHPDHVRALVLLAGAPARGGQAAFHEVEKVALERWKRPATVEALADENLTVQRQETWTSRQRSRWHRITWAAINLHDARRWRHLTGAFFHAAQAGAAAGASMSDTWDLVPVVREAGVPVLVLRGDDDFLPLGFDDWVDEVPQASRVVVPGAGHVPWLDAPAETLDPVREFLREVYASE